MVINTQEVMKHALIDQPRSERRTYKRRTGLWRRGGLRRNKQGGGGWGGVHEFAFYWIHVSEIHQLFGCRISVTVAANTVWVLQRHLMAGGRRNGMWVFNEMKKWNKPYLSPLILLSSFLAVQQVLQVKLLLFSDQVNWGHFSVSSSRLWLNRAEMETLISWLLHFPPLSHTHKPKNLLPSPHPTPQWDFFPFSFYFSPSSSPYSVSLRVSFKFLLRVSSPFTLGWAFQALSASFKFLTSCRVRNKETEGGGKSPWSEIKRYISHETLCSDVE